MNNGSNDSFILQNLMNWPQKIRQRIFCGLAWQFNYQKNNTPPDLIGGYAAFCGKQKNVPTKLSGRKFYLLYSRPYCRCGLITRNCQLRFNCFHNVLFLLTKGIRILIQNAFLSSTFLLIYSYLIKLLST